MVEVPKEVREQLDPGARKAKSFNLRMPRTPKSHILSPEGSTRAQEAPQQPADPSTHHLPDEGGRKQYSLILTKVEPDERDKFRSLEAPETYFEIQKGEVGERVAYSVALTDEEAIRALSDVEDPDVNLHHIEPDVRTPFPSTSVVPGDDVLSYLKADSPAADAMQGAGVTVGVVDSGITPWLRDNVFAGRVVASDCFAQGLPVPPCDPFDDANGHGTYMVPLAVPPQSNLALAKAGIEAGVSPSEVAASINWLVEDVSGVDVICVEAQTNQRFLVVDEAIARADSAGILVMAPAGNGGASFTGTGESIGGSPAASPGAYTVTNYNHELDAKELTSRFGSFVWAASVGSPVYVYDGVGGTDLITDGGTSAAVAVATDLVARLMGTGKTKYQTINHIESFAKRTGAPSTYEGVGLMQLEGVPAQGGGGVMPDPGPVPPDTDPTPVPPLYPGGAWTPALQAELEALVAAVNAATTNTQKITSSQALFAFLERHTNRTMAELIEEWGEVIQDGVERTVTIQIPSIGSVVTLTLGGEFHSTLACKGLKNYPPISFGRNDFDLSVVVSDSGIPPPTGTYWIENVYEDDRMPDIHAHLDDPEFVYLEGESYGRAKDAILLRRLDEIGWSAAGAEGIQEAPGEIYYNYFPYYRIKGSWTTKIAHLMEVPRGSNPPANAETHHTFFTQNPLLGWRPITALENPVENAWWWRSTTEPIRIGTPSMGNDYEAGVHYGAYHPLYDEGTLVNTGADELPGLSCFGAGDCYTNGRGGNYTMQLLAVGDPTITPFQIPIGSGDPEEGTTVDIAHFENPVFRPLSFTGSFDAAFDFSEEAAWNNFLEEIEEYQNMAGLYDPDMVFDEENMEITFTFDRDENAMYLPLPSCSEQIVDLGSVGGAVDDLDYHPHTGFTMDWGGRWFDVGGGTFRVPETGVYTSADFEHFWYEKYQDPDWTYTGQEHTYYKRTSNRFMSAIAGRIARRNTPLGGFPEDNAGWTFSSFVQKPLPSPAGSYTPTIEAAESSSDDGRPPNLTPVPDPLSPIPTPLTPASGGCVTKIDGTSICNWNVPTDPLNPIVPGDTLIPEVPDFEPPDFEPPDPDMPEIPDITPPEFPVIRARYPDFPPFDCKFPDMGNMGPCGPSPGMGGFGPGGRGPSGEPPLPGHGNITTGGPFAGKRDRRFDEKTCYTGPATEVIDELVGELGIDPSTVVVEEGCDAQVDRCFDAGTSKFDALWAVADMCGFQPFDPGDGTPVIADPITPLDKTWTFHELENLFVLERIYSGEGFEVFYAITVFRARVIDNATGSVVVPYFRTTVLTGSPFTDDPTNVSVIEVGPETSDAAAAGLAQREAYKSVQRSAQVQVAVPYNPDYRLREKIVVQRPSRGFQETFMITAIESDLSEDGFIHIISGSMIPGTV